MNLAQTAGSTGLSAIAALFNSGTLQIFTGTIPATPETTATGTLLVQWTFAATAFGSASFATGKETVTASFTSTTASPSSSGTAGYARAFKTDGTTVLADFTVGTSGTDIVLGSTSINTGVPVNLSSFTLSLPAV